MTRENETRLGERKLVTEAETFKWGSLDGLDAPQTPASASPGARLHGKGQALQRCGPEQWLLPPVNNCSGVSHGYHRVTLGSGCNSANSCDFTNLLLHPKDHTQVTEYSIQKESYARKMVQDSAGGACTGTLVPNIPGMVACRDRGKNARSSVSSSATQSRRSL